MFSIDNNDYILHSPSHLGQTIATTQNPNFDYYHLQHSPFTPYFEAFIGNGNSLMMNQLVFDQQDHNLGSRSNTVTSARNDSNNTTHEGSGTKQKEEVPRKRCTKDKHKKIQTAKGLRARRMRLSTVVADKFFHLQDLLGFDKGSMTIAWLLSVSEASIMQLLGSVGAPSGGEEENGEFENEIVGVDVQEGNKGIRRCRRTPTKIVHRSMRTKESRNEARRRARERTMTKRMNIRSGSVVGTMPGSFVHRQETNHLGKQLGSYYTSLETQEDLGPNWSQKTRLNNVEEERLEHEQEQEQEHGLLYDIDFLEYQMDALRNFEKLLESDSSSSSISGDSMAKNSEEPQAVHPWNLSTGVSNGVQSPSGINIFQFQNPALASLVQNPNVSVVSSMVTTSSTMFEEPQTPWSVSTHLH